ncbi:UbiA-like protein EboC [Leptolyngbyaceae cyanobacterium UHCC 1019]
MNTVSLKSQPLWAYFQMLRPANIITAWADILVGFAAAGLVITLSESTGSQASFTSFIPLGWLLLATTGLYGGGVVFNDVFDAALDAQERPERPIPSGRASRQGAIALGGSLLIIGILAAAQVSIVSAAIATLVALAALLYDAAGKHHTILGPLNMGICRGGNLLLGVSALPAMLQERWFLALIPITYIAAITAISQGEVHGGKSSTGIMAVVLVGVVIGATAALGLLPNYAILPALPFAGLLAVRVMPAFINAARDPNPDQIRAAVRAGILSLIVLDAAVAAGFAGWLYGLLILSLLSLSTGLAKLFAVT